MHLELHQHSVVENRTLGFNFQRKNDRNKFSFIYRIDYTIKKCRLRKFNYQKKKLSSALKLSLVVCRGDE